MGELEDVAAQWHTRTWRKSQIRLVLKMRDQDHLDVAHPNDPRPVNTNTYPCECGASFPTGKSRAVHLRACPVRLAQAAAAPPPAPPPPPLRSAESVRHMMECPALAALRLHHDIHPNDDPTSCVRGQASALQWSFARTASAGAETRCEEGWKAATGATRSADRSQCGQSRSNREGEGWVRSS